MHSTFTDAAVVLCGPAAGDPEARFLHQRSALGPDADRDVQVDVTIGNDPSELTITYQRENEVGLRKDFYSTLDSPLASSSLGSNGASTRWRCCACVNL